MKERRPDFLDLFPPSGSSMILCIELLVPRELRLPGVPFSESLLPGTSCLNISLSPSDFLLKGTFADSESARGFFTATTRSESEPRALSFCLAASFLYIRQPHCY